MIRLNSQREWWRPAVNDGPILQIDKAVDTESDSDGSPIPFRALMVFTFVLLISPQSFLPVLAPLRLAMLAAAVATLSYVLDRFVHRRPIVKFTQEIWIALFLFCWAVVTIPISYWPGGSVATLTGVYAKTMIVFVLLTQIITSLRRLRLVLWGLSLMVAPIALIALFNLFTSTYIDGHSRITGYKAPLTENPNDLALTLNLILPLIVALFLTNRKPMVRAMLLVFICLSAIAIIATFSRGGFLTLLVTTFTYLFIMFKRGQRLWVILALFLMVSSLPFLPSDYVDRVSTITDIQSDETGSAQARWRDMVAGGIYVLHNPLIGAGLGMDVLALNEIRGPLWTMIHNAYLQYAMDLGIPGLILYIMLLAGCIKAMRNVQAGSATSGTKQESYFFAQGIRISLVAFAVAAMFHPIGYHFYFYYIAGLAIALQSIGLSRKTQEIRCETFHPYPSGSVHEYR